MAMVNVVMLICCLLMPPGQAAQNKAANSVISGRVTLNAQPAANITIVAFSNRRGSREVIAKAITDANGYYRLINLAAGSYRLTTLAPGYFTENYNNMYETGKTVNLDDGDEVENIDFSLQRGGVITGRITDANHQPIIEERINLIPIDAKPQPMYEPPVPFNPRNMLTDDRGVYRLFALPPGKYKVYVGEEGSTSINAVGRRSLHVTYYPGTTDLNKAEIIEVTEGSEVSNIDITLSETVKTYQASGRIIDAETGKPLSGIRYDCGVIYEGVHNLYGRGETGVTNSRGEFRIEGVKPGRYAAFTIPEKADDTYSEPAVFEIKDADVSNLEVKVRRGASISGRAIVEGAGDINLSALLPTVYPQVIVEDGLAVASVFYQSLAADGSFKSSGLAPGRKILVIYSRDQQFTILRVEHNGVDITKGFTVKAGEQLTGIRLVLGYGSGTIRGEVKIENGTLPENARMFVQVYLKGNETTGISLSKPPDSRGRFVYDSLSAGEYEVFLIIESTTVKRLHQTVTVSSGATTQVSFVVDAQAKDPDR